MYLQQLVAEKVVELGTVKSAVNSSDLCTKHHPSDRLRMLKARCMLAERLTDCLDPAGELEDISHWREVLSLELMTFRGQGGGTSNSADMNIYFCLLAVSPQCLHWFVSVLASPQHAL